ncbi:Pvc16 family protein [Synechococcus sp. PCC 7336]|uniref:Pvc16 family protein n=1 Tax=Synechococcus sp. PCC 7336 TaxID=195250 RepID=UPI000345AD12|nr:Pvc16 family protein [Synechococcus sp. PCC 7336]
MISDLSQILGRILEESAVSFSAQLPELASALIAFDRPTDPYTPSQTTVNLFLHDIRENLERRNNEPTIDRRNGLITQRRAPMRIDCSYLVTAWPIGGEELTLQEHRLLSQVLQVFAGYPFIPAEFLQSTLLEGQEPPLPLITAQADTLQNPSEFWNSIGNKIRPSLTVTATIAVDPITLEVPELPMVITRELSFLEPAEATAFHIGGQVLDAGGTPVARATVTAIEPNLSTTTRSDGRYRLGPLSSGTYTLRVQTDIATQEVSIAVPATTSSNYNVQMA